MLVKMVIIKYEGIRVKREDIIIWRTYLPN